MTTPPDTGDKQPQVNLHAATLRRLGARGPHATQLHAAADEIDALSAKCAALEVELRTFSLSGKWDRLIRPTYGMRKRMIDDEELSDEEFQRLAHRISLEAHEDRLKLWETALSRWERIQALALANDSLEAENTRLREALQRIAVRPHGHHDCDDYSRGYGQCKADMANSASAALAPQASPEATSETEGEHHE